MDQEKRFIEIRLLLEDYNNHIIDGVPAKEKPNISSAEMFEYSKFCEIAMHEEIKQFLKQEGA